MRLNPDDKDTSWTSFEFSETVTYGSRDVTARLQVSRAYRRESVEHQGQVESSEGMHALAEAGGLTLDRHSKWLPLTAFSLRA